MIFYNGLDVTKEILYGIIGDQFSRRGIACLVIDTPGTGEPLRLRGVPSRPDYEVPTAAIVDYLQTRPDVAPGRIGLHATSQSAEVRVVPIARKSLQTADYIRLDPSTRSHPP